MAQVRSATMATESAGTSASIVPARILKKRETDRRCQRMIRERTKSRIAYLEGLVEQFRQQDSSGRVETLMKQLSEMTNERDNLAKKVKNIETIITDNKCKTEPETQSSPVSHATQSFTESDPIPNLSVDPHSDFSLPQTVTAEPMSAHSPHDTSKPYQIHNKEFTAYVKSSSRSSWASSPLPAQQGQPCECSTNTFSLDSNVPTNKWKYANDTLTEWFKWSPQALDLNQYTEFNEDVPVRAVVEGWDVVEKKGYMHPLWRLLRGIDQHVFSSCNPRERLAILQTMGLLLQAHMNPTRTQESKLPMFYLKRPSQDMLHAYAIEYFIWPGLRERFVFQEHRYCSNIFWRILCTTLHVQWPYEFRDCYIRNTETGLYSISPSFKERIGDIQNWTVGIDMFKQYPELYGDIPADNHIPASVTPVSSLPRQSSCESLTMTSNTTIGTGRRKRDQDRSSNGKRTPVSDHVDNSSPFSSESPLPAPSQNMITQYSPLSTGSYNPASMAVYDLPYQSIITSVGDMQQVQAMTPWVYSDNLDMFQTHST